ncbi:hypothetical protein LAJ19_14835 (plasmid) [Deinococcus taeanensis]|uniref:hypothetical protein n=1 Tax=Deinococcus taeanensis TaxID=2737050 RepID=UPI001CDC6632|nr:hypothetical protein [Deinococcus taeanensis]UBV44085.1 hypothetical protein LAJ19_14835 [Deinococcus taeanensis]
MARLRMPDGRLLPGPASTLWIQPGAWDVDARDPPGGVTAHPALLLPYLRALETLLDQQMDRAEHDESLEVRQQEQVIQSVLLGQALAVGLDAYAAQPDAPLLELIGDLAATLDLLSPLGEGVMRRVTTIQTASGGALPNVPLLPEEFAQAVAMVLDTAAQVNRPAGAQAAQRLTWAGYRTPPLRKDPLDPSRAALTPPATLDPARFAQAQALRALAMTSDEAGRNAALLLLHVTGRDRLQNAPLISVLDTAQVLLLSWAQSLRDAGEDQTAADALRGWHAQLHRALGSPTLPLAQRFRRGATGHLGGHVRAARRLLRALRHDRLRAPTAAEQRHLESLWQALDALDRDLAAGVTPEQDETLQVRLILLSLQGLTSTFRAPGMNLPPMVQLAAQVSGVDPLWAWDATQPRGNVSHDLRGELDTVLRSLLLLELRDTAAWTTWQARAGALITRAAGHLLATVRRAGLRLPEQRVLERYFAQFGPLRALPLTNGAFRQLNDECLEALTEAERLLGEEPPAPDGPPRRSADPPAQPPSVPPVPAAPALPGLQNEPAHVLAARARLQGQRVVLLGSVRSAEHHASLVRALALRELDWISSAAYAHGTHAQAHVTADTALVILAIRWMGHAHSALRDVARAKNVPFVMHPGGFSPSSVAWQVMQQVSHQLDARHQEGKRDS